MALTRSSFSLEDFLPRVERLTNITPFTYRDSATYLEILESLNDWVRNGLLDQVNSAISSLADAYHQSAKEFYNKVITMVTELELLPEQVDERFRKWDRDERDRFERLKIDLINEIKERQALLDVRVKGWMDGNVDTSIHDHVRAMREHAFDHGMRAGDSAALGMTVDEWDDLTIEEIEFRFRELPIYHPLDPAYRHSPFSGRFLHEREIVDEMINEWQKRVYTGTMDVDGAVVSDLENNSASFLSNVDSKD